MLLESFLNNLLVLVIMAMTVMVFGQIPEPMSAECRNVSVSEQEVGLAIFETYNGTWQRPRLNVRHAVVLNLSLSLAAINDVMEKDGLIHVTAYLALRWFDEFHVWNDSFPLNCVPYIVVSATDVWRPDVAQMNSQSKYALMDMPGEKIRIHSNGFTTFSPGGTFAAFCDFDFTLFPFDTQKCAIQLESWRYTHDYVTFSLLHRHTTKIKLYQFLEHDQWQVVDTKQQIIDQEYTYKELRFDRVEFTIWIKRKPTYYLLHVVVPSIIISLAEITVFSIDARETVKMALSFTCLLAYAIFQLQISEGMPHSSDRVPYLSIYIDLQMSYIALSMLVQGLTFLLLSDVGRNLLELDGDYVVHNDVPRWIYSKVAALGKILGVKSPPKEKAIAELLLQHNVLYAAPGVDELRRRLTAFTKGRQSDSTPANVTSNLGRGACINKTVMINRRYRWFYMATVANRLNFAVYMSCLILTPLIIFLRAMYYKPLY